MLLQIHAQELPRPEFAVLGHAGRIDRHRPGLGTREHPAIARERIAHGTQPAPIQDRPEEAAVSEDERRGTIPGLRQAGVVPVQRPVPRRQFRVSLPCLRHQHHHGVAQVPAGQVEQLRRVIQHAGVRGVRVDHRKQRLAKGIPERGAQVPLPGAHPGDVPLQCINLAVVGQTAEGLRAAPRRPGVGAVPLVVDDRLRDERRVPQVAIEGGELRRDHQALVDDGPRRQRRDIRGLAARAAAGEGGFHPLARPVQAPLEGLGAIPRRSRRQQVLDFGATLARIHAQSLRVNRHRPPDEGGDRLLGEGLLRRPAGVNACPLVPREEEDAHADVIRRDAPADLHLPVFLHEERPGQLRQDARPVPGRRIRREGAAVRQARQRPKPHAQHLVRRAVQTGDEAGSAGVVLRSRVVVGKAPQQ